jgi:anaerobic magnesium-protoporphyrin IX monomethyl ester cyclase
MLDILFITPSLSSLEDKIKARHLNPNIGIAYLLAATAKNKLRAKYIDMVFEDVSVMNLLEFIAKEKPHLIGFTAFTTQVNAAYFIANLIKKRFPQILICLGGPHATALKQEIFNESENIDFIILGEAEHIIKDIMAGNYNVPGLATKENQNSKISRIFDLDSLEFPAWNQFNLNNYAASYADTGEKELPMSTSRGCHSYCIFCVRPFGTTRIARSAESIVEEIEHNVKNYGCKVIDFLDETFIENIDEFSKLADLILKKNLQKQLKWKCETRVDNFSPELAKLMKTAGCYYIYFGLESANETILRNSGKGTNPQQIRTAIQNAKNANINCAGSFIIGLPGDTKETVLESIQLAKELDMFSVTFPIAVPFPGTALRELAIHNKFGMKILTNNWDDYDKQYPGVLDSEDLPIEERQNLQKLAYELLPKKTELV